MGNKLYDEAVLLTDRQDVHLKTVIDYHRYVHNLALAHLEKEPKLKFQDLKQILRPIVIARANEKACIESVVYNEIHYLFNKWRKGTAVAKTNRDIFYLAFRISGYQHTSLEYKAVESRLYLPKLDIYIHVQKPLPDIGNKTVYLNISYSDRTGEVRVSVFES